MNIVLQVYTFIGALGMFLYRMTMMSEGLHKTTGDKLRSFLASMTSNSFKRVLTGLGVTALVQSSSATTIMVVSFVNAGLLTLGNAIGVVIETLGFANPMTVDLTNPEASQSLLYGISMLHTHFNITITPVIIWFTPD